MAAGAVSVFASPCLSSAHYFQPQQRAMLDNGHPFADVAADEDVNLALPFLSPDFSLQDVDEANSLQSHYDHSSLQRQSADDCPDSALVPDTPIATTEPSAPTSSSTSNHSSFNFNQSRPHALTTVSTSFSPLPCTLTAPSPSSSTQSSSITSYQTAKSGSKALKRSLTDSQSPAEEDEAVIEKRQRNTIAARKARRKKDDRIASLEAELKAVTKERDEVRLMVARLEGENAALKKMAWK